MVSPETIQILIQFLVTTATIAAQELRERWKLRRSQQEVDLLEHNADDREVSKMVRDALSDQQEEGVRGILNLMERKKEAIYRAERGKLNHREDYRKGFITADMLELRIEDLDTEIETLLGEIEIHLKSLGLQVDRQPS